MFPRVSRPCHGTIRINPRTAGHEPRATQIVGHDQYTRLAQAPQTITIIAMSGVCGTGPVSLVLRVGNAKGALF